MKRLYEWRRPLAVLLMLAIAVSAFLPFYTLTVTVNKENSKSQFGLGIVMSLMQPQNLLIEEDPQTRPFSRLEGLIDELTTQGQPVTGIAVAAGLAAVLTIGGIIIFFILLISSLLGRFTRKYEILAFIHLGITVVSFCLLWIAGKWLTATLSSPSLEMSSIGKSSVELFPLVGFYFMLAYQAVLAFGIPLLRKWKDKQPQIEMKPIV